MMRIEKIKTISPDQMEMTVNSFLSGSLIESYMTYISDEQTLEDRPYEYFLEPEDLRKLKVNLSFEDLKRFLKMIPVWIEITAPIKWWMQFNSMNVSSSGKIDNTNIYKFVNKHFTYDDFSCEDLIDYMEDPALLNDVSPFHDNSIQFSPKGLLGLTICVLNKCHDKFKETNNEKYLDQINHLLPSSYNVTKTVMVTYMDLYDIYDEYFLSDDKDWSAFCNKFVSELPYFKEFIGDSI